MIKTTGAEFKRFYSDATTWPDDVWHDDECVLVDGGAWDHPEGYEAIPDAAKVEVSDGGVYGLPNNKEISFEGYFKQWRKRQTTTTFLVECDLTKVDEVKAAVKAAGGKVV
jgi:hypothetical protein